MAGKVKLWVPDQLVFTFGPVVITSGFADGEFCRIEQESDDTVDQAGSDGEVVVSRTNDRRANVTLILQQTAEANDQLSIYSNLVVNAPSMAGAIQAWSVKDLNGRAIYTAQNCWIKRPPDVSYAREPASREWQFRVAHLIRVDGGS